MMSRDRRIHDANPFESRKRSPFAEINLRMTDDVKDFDSAGDKNGSNEGICLYFVPTLFRELIRFFAPN